VFVNWKFSGYETTAVTIQKPFLIVQSGASVIYQKVRINSKQDLDSAEV
jgi:hypothetical protein